VRKGFAFPEVYTVTTPFRSAGRLSLPAEQKGKRRRAAPESQRLSAQQAAESRFFPDFDATLIGNAPAFQVPC
jgi:hypothetical protein